jgi:hypothetical protein
MTESVSANTLDNRRNCWHNHMLDAYAHQVPHSWHASDPCGLLEGSGRVHRYIQLHAASDLRQAGVNQLVKAAFTAWKQRK